jgi:hypothetical protein
MDLAFVPRLPVLNGRPLPCPTRTRNSADRVSRTVYLLMGILPREGARVNQTFLDDVSEIVVLSGNKKDSGSAHNELTTRWGRVSCRRRYGKYYPAGPPHKGS